MTHRRILKLAAVAAFVLALAGLAQASGGGESNPMHVVWQVVNFAIFIGVLFFFARKPVAIMMAERREGIRKSLDEARQARELAEKALSEVKDQLANKDRQVQEIIAAAHASGLKEREALIAEGERMSRKLMEQAKQNIEFELKKATEAIKAEAVEVAMELAEKKMTDKLKDADRQRLFAEALKKLEDRN